MPAVPFASKPKRCWYLPVIKPALEGAQTVALTCASVNTTPFYANDSEEEEVDPEINSKNAIRNTLYWNPYFHPNEKGVSTVNYLNSEVETKVKLRLEGLTVNGIPVVTQTYYKTEK